MSNLFARAVESFLHALGTTFLGFITPVLVFLLTVVVTLAVIAHQKGMEEMKQHWRENAALTAWVTIIVMLLVYGPIFLWHLLVTMAVVNNRPMGH